MSIRFWMRGVVVGNNGLLTDKLSIDLIININIYVYMFIIFFYFLNIVYKCLNSRYLVMLCFL